MNKIKIKIKNRIELEVDSHLTLLEISKQFKNDYKFDIIAGQIDSEIVSLNQVVTKDCAVDFYDRSTLDGYVIYEKTLHFILIAAVKRVCGSSAELVIEHSIDKGFYCEIKDHIMTNKLAIEISNAMQAIIDEDIVIKKVNIARLDAISYFKIKNQLDKVNLLKYISNTYINLYLLDGIYDYFFTELAYSTKSINSFLLTYIDEHGFVVSLPTIYNPSVTSPYVHHKLLFDAFMKYTLWGRSLAITNVSDFNHIIATGNYDNFVKLAENYFEEQLSELADKIDANRQNIKMVLIAGPSSSGKTTTAKKLEIFLNNHNIKTHQISIDNYFVNRVDTPKDEFGEYDYECVESIDLKTFNEDMAKLLAKEEVLIPEYNFITGQREYNGKRLKMNDSDVIIIEGLHALNSVMSSSIKKENKMKVYISPLTHLNIDNHNRIHTSDLRRLRRIVRDNKFRGYQAGDTLRMWEKIKAGEEKYIFPFQDDADFIINSALVYEIGVLKVYAEPLLFTVAEDDSMYHEAKRLINFLRNFLPIPSEVVPKDSILREFVGK